MKKLFNVLILMSIFIFINNGCKKCDDTPDVMPPTTITTIKDLEGTWKFQNFYCPDPTVGNITTCPYTYLGYPVLLSLKFTGSTCTITDCTGVIIAKDYPTTLTSENVIHMFLNNDNFYNFKIKSYNYPILVLVRPFNISTYQVMPTELTVKKI